MDQFTALVEKIDGYVWGVPLITMILLVGIYLTIRLRGLQIRKLPKALKYMIKNEE
ncbi:MAG: sodium:alanine symporter family protein, partial [Lachnospiraceae bacterium]|nr:sodium:alanine symporter family protein [Lachnospiraceae bacterium]